MKKKIVSLCVALMMLFVISVPAYASEAESEPETEYHHVVDSKGLLSEKNRQKIEKAAQSVYENNGVDLFAYIVDETIESADDTGESIYRSYAYTKSSVIMMVDPKKVYIRTYGRAKYIFTEDETQEMTDEVLKQKSDAALLMKFVKLCGSMLTEKGVQPVPDERLQPRLVDGAGLLSESDQSALLEQLDEVSERQQFDVAIVTISSLDGRTVVEYADDFYDYNGYGFGDDADGILLLVSMDTREWAINTTGLGETIFTDKGQEYITDQFVSYLSDGDYYGGFALFAELCDQFIEEYTTTGKAYDYGNMPKEPFGWFGAICGSLVVGVIAGIIVALSLKSQLTSVKPQAMANAYIRQGSMQITERNDLFLYHNITRVARPKDNDSRSGGGGGGGSSTHHSSSGRSHGGSHGHF